MGGDAREVRPVMALVSARTITLSMTMAASGTVMMVMGVLVMADWPSKIGMSGRTALLFGIPLCAMGQFLYAAAAGLLCPDADPRVTGFFELTPWLALAIALAGVLI